LADQGLCRICGVAVGFRSNFVVTPGKADNRFRTAEQFVNDLQLIAGAKLLKGS